MATVTMKLQLSHEFLGKEGTKTVFTDIDEPITSDELCELFFRFALACGYSEKSIATSMVGVGDERVPPVVIE